MVILITKAGLGTLCAKKNEILKFKKNLNVQYLYYTLAFEFLTKYAFT